VGFSLFGTVTGMGTGNGSCYLMTCIVRNYMQSTTLGMPIALLHHMRHISQSHRCLQTSIEDVASGVLARMLTKNMILEVSKHLSTLLESGNAFLWCMLAFGLMLLD
jgi:hypothetical protein